MEYPPNLCIFGCSDITLETLLGTLEPKKSPTSRRFRVDFGLEDLPQSCPLCNLVANALRLYYPTDYQDAMRNAYSWYLYMDSPKAHRLLIRRSRDDEDEEDDDRPDEHNRQVGPGLRIFAQPGKH